ncbi:hypothetical protein DYU11_02235 [Fibrisoma montanum]|uniref:Uncharacterized protein n=2 Tax=Fibrisoma montanum TaxID=2305895 RepID=A0A418MI97_9BACT|nr:hypothetical protein DYU11_02235 [Fibrisoma montanum]
MSKLYVHLHVSVTFSPTMAMRFLLTVLLICPLFVQAQERIDTLHWSATRRLKLSDFHGDPQPGQGISEFYYQLGYDVQPTLIRNRPIIDAYCLMFRNLSWVVESARTEQTLQYNQILFDLVEVHARRMKTKLIELKADRHFKDLAKQIEYRTNAELTAQVNQFRAETNGGNSFQALERWQQKVAQMLYDTPDMVTTYHQSDVGLGVFLGGSAMQPTGGISRTLNPPTGLVYSFDVVFRQYVLLLQPSLYSATIRDAFSQNDQTWNGGMKVSAILFEAGLGTIVHESPRHRVIPYVGYSLLNMLPRDRRDERYKGYSLVNHAPVAGVVWDFKLGSNDRNPNRASDAFWFIRAKLSYTPVLTAKSFSGGLLNLQLGLGGFSRPRRISYEPERTTLTFPGRML